LSVSMEQRRCSHRDDDLSQALVMISVYCRMHQFPDD
jgi:hypothetical protein